MKKRLLRFEPIQLGKMLGALYGAMSLIFIPFMLIFAIAASFAPQPQGQDVPQGFFLGFGIVFLIFAPVFYGVMGFLTGIIGALVYNLIAKWIGGIEVEVQ